MGVTELADVVSGAASTIVEAKIEVQLGFGLCSLNADKKRERNRGKAARFRARKRAELEAHINKYMSVKRENSTLRAQVLEMERRIAEIQQFVQSDEISDQLIPQQPLAASYVRSKTDELDECASDDLDICFSDGLATEWSGSSDSGFRDEILGFDERAEQDDDGMVHLWFG